MSLVSTVLQAPSFKKATKKLHKNQKADLDQAIAFLIQQPLSGEQKKGDLAYLRVYKFKMVNQETLLGYSYEQNQLILELLSLGSHENFYRDLKA
jgi:mRNA-degrading endonuclease YafQ of YafQ-DinJ toxin-antitoxin module